MSIARRITALLCLSAALPACTPPPLEPVPVLRQPAPHTQQQVSQQPVIADPLDASVYRLSTGDAVRIDVLGEPELSIDTPIDPSGYINYPFLGRVRAGGQTVRVLEQQIRAGLAAGYLINPDVRVSLSQYRPIFISGQVRQAGTFPYTLGLTVKQALALAGGITTYGSEKRIFLQRQGAGGERIRVDLDSRVFPGDTLVVDERLF